MTNETMWNIFKSTGSIEAYLYCKDCEVSKKENKDYPKEMNEKILQVQ